MRPARDYTLLWIALAILIVDSVLLALAIVALRDPRVSFPLLPRATATAPAKP